MKRITLLIACLGLIAVLTAPALAATQQTIQTSINDGLKYLISAQYGDGHWEYGDTRSDLAATSSAALAFVEEGYLPGVDVVIGTTNYGDVVGDAVNWVFDRAMTQRLGWEMESYGARTSPTDTYYKHHAEDYNFNAVLDTGEGNGAALFFASADIYSNGITAPLVYALGQKLGKDTTVGMGTAAINGLTYGEAMQDIIDWFSWGQVEPNRGAHRGGWRYYPNYGTSDNSTAQWGALPILYANSWGLEVPQNIKDELELWIAYIQNANGGSGYDSPYSYVNVSKTGGLILEMLACGYPVSDADLQAAIAFINGRWNNWASGWYGNLNQPYAMWAVYKALLQAGYLNDYGTGAGEDFPIGNGIGNAPGGITIGQDWDPKTSLQGDWYSHYCDGIVNWQNANGSWNGSGSWHSELAAGWYINILNATGAPPPDPEIPEPGTMALFGLGLCGLVAYGRKRKNSK